MWGSWMFTRQNSHGCEREAIAKLILIQKNDQKTRAKQSV